VQPKAFTMPSNILISSKIISTQAIRLLTTTVASAQSQSPYHSKSTPAALRFRIIISASSTLVYRPIVITVRGLIESKEG
jgi:hypothetical protein